MRPIKGLIANLQKAKEELENSKKELEKNIGESERQRLAILNILEDVDEAREKLARANEELMRAQVQLIQAGKMAAIGQLGSGVAHEINNPLTGILNGVQLIKLMSEQKQTITRDEIKEFIEIIESSALRCKTITQSLLDFSHASTGKFELLSLREVIDKVLLLIEYEMRLHNITVHQQLEDNLPKIKGDSQLLQQVFFNLISNARWAIEKKNAKEGGRIIIKANYDRSKNCVKVSVSDTGIGIPKKDLSRIFDAFFTTKEVGKGTGLGLSIVYNIIKEHKGDIQVESKLGEGTTFMIELPLA